MFDFVGGALENTIVLGPLPTLDFGGGFVLPTYPVYMSLLLMGLVYYVYKRALKRDHSGVTALDLFLICVGGGAVGARLLHVIYEEPGYYWQHPLKIFYFWQGGFVFYGGLLCGLLAGWIALKIKGQSFTHWLDFFTPVVSVGYAFGRLACFLAGCCFGTICDLPWAISVKQMDLTTGRILEVHRHPTQLYASALEFVLFLVVLHLERKNILVKRPGHLFLFWLIFHSLTRAGLEFFRNDDRGATFGFMSISMILSFVMAAFALTLFLRQRRS
ncbi:MAG: prolipoprotein diacylglyceryl transferase [Bdellovibrionaceae bacterium]|nr:prolipoprotein diacylglyceryl transferase [Pseudobdellovibrionaceae bacterium]